MARLVALRVAGMVPLMFIISLLVAALLNLVPGGPAFAILGENATPQAVAEVNRQLGLDQPFLSRYFSWVGGVLHGDLGHTLFGGEPVLRAILARAPVTLSLVLAAVLIQLVLGVAFGVVSGFRPRSWFDRVASTSAGVLLSVPGFWLGLVLILVFSQRLGVLPGTGFVPLSQNPVEFARHLVLPALALAGAESAELFRQTRAAVVETSQRDFVRAARAAGFTERSIALRNVGKNSMVPVVTVFGLQLGRMIGVAAVIESVFGIQGIGSLMVTAALNADFPVVQGVVLMTAAVVLVVNLLVDISYRYFNPKLRQA